MKKWLVGRTLQISIAFGLFSIGCTMPSEEVDQISQPLIGGTLYRATFWGGAGDNLLTVNGNEYNNLPSGWTKFGAQGSIWSERTTDSNRRPLYRMWSSQGTDHLFTWDAAEYDNDLNLGWIGEGDILDDGRRGIGYVYPEYANPGGPCARRVYRMWSQPKHLYTIDFNEMNTLDTQALYDREAFGEFFIYGC
ncbi:MAG TPA: hypothetical protein VK550_31830 [Polyangiaceae bacterium]|nr:hypothetical protein [Polyangiaceae bacterium]